MVLSGPIASIGNFNWQGYYGDVLVTAAVTPAQRQKIEGWLAHRWGLTSLLPSTHPYATVSP